MKKTTFLTICVVIALSVSAQFSNGTFLLTEGQYGSSTGGLFWLSPETMVFGESSTSGEVNGVGYGETSQFATFYGDKLYVTSKQSGSYGGGLLTVAEASSIKNLKVFTELASDGHSYDGRAFCGISETKGYMGTSNGIFVIDLQSLEIMKFIEGTDCGYGVGETINGSWYAYDVYWNQIGSMVRVGERVFVSQQNRGILVINAETDEVETIISAENFSGSFGDLVLAKDGSLWTTTCTTENYSYEHHPEQNVLIKIDPYTLETETIELQSKVSVSWGTWRTPMMQACKSQNRIIWKDVFYTDYSTWETVGAPQICYYDIDTKEEGVLVNLADIDPNYSIYSGLCIDPETDLIYVPVASSSGYGPWYLLIFNQQGELMISPISIPIGDYSDYPAMALFTDDYAPVFNLEDKYLLNVNETLELNLLDIVTDKDHLDAGIIVEIDDAGDSSIATSEISQGKLFVKKISSGNSQITLKANSNGKISTATINIVNSTTSINNIDYIDHLQANYCDGTLTVNNCMDKWGYIYDISGKCVSSIFFDCNSFSTPLNLSPGIYIITVENNTTKFIVK